MTTHITKTWFDGEKVVTQEIPESEIYKQEPVEKVVLTETLELPCLQWLDLNRHFDFKGGEYLYTTPQPQREWVGLTDEEKRSVCRVGPVYAPDGVVTRNPLEYRKELEGVALMAVRQAETKLKEKNGGAA